jgi:hypothetical protein
MERVLDSHWLLAFIVDCNCKQVPVNPVIQSKPRYFRHADTSYVTIWAWGLGIRNDSADEGQQQFTQPIEISVELLVTQENKRPIQIV